MAPSFYPSNDHTTDFSQLQSLDMLPAQGLAEIDFWKLFSKCRSCLHLMTTRTIPYHVCSISGQHHFSPNKIDRSVYNEKYRDWLGTWQHSERFFAEQSPIYVAA